MKIYFAGAIAGGRNDLGTYEHVVEHLKSRGHAVPTHHVADPRVLEREAAVSPREVYERDIEWMRESDTVVAEVSTPSLGVGYEIAWALQQGKPVLCLFRDGLSISKMITGNSSPRLCVRTYRDLGELDRNVDAFLESLT